MCNFLKENDLLCVVRAHEAKDAGFQMFRKSPFSKFPSLISIFSAPNYCDTYGNKGVILCLADGQLNIKVIELFFDQPQKLPPRHQAIKIGKIDYVNARIQGADSLKRKTSSSQWVFWNKISKSIWNKSNFQQKQLTGSFITDLENVSYRVEAFFWSN